MFKIFGLLLFVPFLSHAQNNISESYVAIQVRLISKTNLSASIDPEVVNETTAANRTLSLLIDALLSENQSQSILSGTDLTVVRLSNSINSEVDRSTINIKIGSTKTELTNYVSAYLETYQKTRRLQITLTESLGKGARVSCDYAITIQECCDGLLKAQANINLFKSSKTIYVSK